MFTVPSTPLGQTRSATGTNNWSRYINPPSRSTNPSSSFNNNNHSNTQRQQHLSSTPTPTPTTTITSSSPLLQTPLPYNRKSSISTSVNLSTPTLETDPHSSSPMQSAYPDTPSPHSTYGVNGSLMVTGPTIMQSHPHSHHHHPSSECGQDVFMSQTTPGKAPRPPLRSSLSHNAAIHSSSSSTWPRRVMTTTTATATTATSSLPPPPPPPSAAASIDSRTSTIRSTANMSGPSMGTVSGNTTVATTESASASAPSVNGQNQTHQNHHHQHEAYTSFVPPHHQSTATATATPSSTSTSTPQVITPATHPHPQPYSYSHYQFGPPPPPPSYTYSSSDNNNSNNNNGLSPYTPSSYGWGNNTGGNPNASSLSSSWPPMSSSIIHPHQQQSPYHWSMHHMAMPAKQDEPILAPGELPAPRPPMSYAALIGEALLLAPPPHQLYVSEISDSIKKRYAYYRQNPTKIYNGVRHQTSMCKAFVKLPRPFGDQSGGARKWAIRAGCETWFAGGGYHPPTVHLASSVGVKPKSGKAKATARAKQLAIGVDNERKMLPPPDYPLSASSGEGPSSGPAYDGTTRVSSAFMPFSSGSTTTPYSNDNNTSSYGAPAPPSQQTTGHLPPGYHYVPLPPSNQGQPQPPPFYLPVWGPYNSHPHHGYGGHGYPHTHAYGQQQQQHNYQPPHGSYNGLQTFDPAGSESPEAEQWRPLPLASDNRSNDGTHVDSSYEEIKLGSGGGVQPTAHSPADSVHSYQGGSIHSSQHGNSPQTM
ncbi:hypothetical protein CI109_105672 [Kwoniella shandongensis]|uniref:Uncharacterized protein n=1 Tax=Kwoniella shandongensis TaxID=1734106 RepID=A0A5M6C1J4_9TREE|nr:uncharacterized protein CI109_003012 [Kwoniella shandongensis]KAA5528480.1 hypothetical protein CI109_003012 [Kwoniella shandongensis]